MPQDRDLRVLQGSDIHACHISGARAFRKRLSMDRGDCIVDATEDHILQAPLLLVRHVRDACGHVDIPAEEMSLHIDDIGLAATQDKDPVPDARPDREIDEELEVAQVLLCKEHRGEVVGRAQELETLGLRCRHVLLDRRVGMAGEERMGMDI